MWAKGHTPAVFLQLANGVKVAATRHGFGPLANTTYVPLKPMSETMSAQS